MNSSDTPFPHWVIDDFLPEEMAQAAYEHFFDGVDSEWIRREHLYSRGKRTRIAGLHQAVETALQRLESVEMRYYLTQLTGIKDLQADPERFGGGQHVTAVGGRLGIHADFTHHPKTGMRLALNLLLYLNKVTDGGWLELWEPTMRLREQNIIPKWNRAVIFKTSPTSFHGHPWPTMTERLSLAVYYYVQGEPGSAEDYLPTTDYRPRPWEYGLRVRRWLSRLAKG